MRAADALAYWLGGPAELAADALALWEEGEGLTLALPLRPFGAAAAQGAAAGRLRPAAQPGTALAVTGPAAADPAAAGGWAGLHGETAQQSAAAPALTGMVFDSAAADAAEALLGAMALAGPGEAAGVLADGFPAGAADMPALHWAGGQAAENGLPIAGKEAAAEDDFAFDGFDGAFAEPPFADAGRAAVSWRAALAGGPIAAQPAVGQPAVGQPAVGQPAAGQPAAASEVGAFPKAGYAADFWPAAGKESGSAVEKGRTGQISIDALIDALEQRLLQEMQGETEGVYG